MTFFQVLWFVVLGVLLGGYAVLDGFDLGVGVLHPFVRGEKERRLSINSIGPFWDGNEVWLVTFAGALFAGFPNAYATLLSGMYLPVMVLLFAIIGRAVSIEFRSKRDSKLWRAYWDYSFSFSSVVALFLFGVLAGNAVSGIALDDAGEYRGGLLELFGFFPVLVGLFAVAAAAMHGSIFLFLKTEGSLQARAKRWMWRTYFVFVAAYVATTAATLALVPHATESLGRWPAAWIVVALNVLAVLNVPRAIHRGRPGDAFFSSCCTILALVFLFGLTLFPNLVVSSGPGPSLTIVSAASSDETLERLALIAAIGAPLVTAYTVIVYRVFWGKVRLGPNSY